MAGADAVRLLGAAGTLVAEASTDVSWVGAVYLIETKVKARMAVAPIGR